MSCAGGPDLITNGLVLCIDAADKQSYSGSGTIWRDLVGSNNGTLINGPTYSSANNGSIIFDGTDDYVSMPTTSSGDSLDFTTQMSFTVWVFPIVGCGLYIFAKNLNGGYADQQYGCDFENNETRFVLSGDSTLRSTGNSVPYNTWTNICGVWNGSKQLIYINGLLNAIRDFSTIPTFKPNLFIGWRSNGASNHYFKGRISNLTFYKRALSELEVLQNYKSLKGRFQLT